MTDGPSTLSLILFALFVGVTLGLSFYLGRKARSSAGYFAAHGQIPWFVNGVAFAGDYLSAASFLGICGMIAFYGYDGFLYSIGYLAGWIVALFVVAEPMKRLGKFTFADALDAKFGSRGIRFAAGISTLAVSVFYLIPQMVGAGALIRPLLGLPQWTGVIIVGAVVVLIVLTAGMVSTTWVQFIKGTLLVIFSAVLTVMILSRGLKVEAGGIDGHRFRSFGPFAAANWEQELRAALDSSPEDASFDVLPPTGVWETPKIVRLRHRTSGETTYWVLRDLPPEVMADSAEGTSAPASESSGRVELRECQSEVEAPGEPKRINGLPLGDPDRPARLHPVGHVERLPDGKTETGPLGPIGFLATVQQSRVVLWRPVKLRVEGEGDRAAAAGDPRGTSVVLHVPTPTDGSRLLRPGEHKVFKGIRSGKLLDKVDFISLMLALFAGTASLPHILIRYYTVKDASAARKSTIVGIASIGFFYVLTLFIGLGAMTSGAIDVSDSNMAAPLLARSLGEWLFAVISAIAFTTVLGTVSGLILASTGAITHDLLALVVRDPISDAQLVRFAKIAAVAVGAVAIVLGIVFQGFNVNFLVGWAFSVAASANLPSLVMILFWKRTTRYGVIAAVLIGMITSLGWILASGESYETLYGWDRDSAFVPFSQPGIVTIPLGFLVLILVSIFGPQTPSADRPRPA